VIKVYFLVRSQVRLAPMGDIIGLDYNAIKFVMDMYKISSKQYVFEKILQCFDIERELSK